MAQPHTPSPESAGYASYLVRLWRDDVHLPDGAWQGEVQHIQSGGCWRFQTVADLLVFLSSRIEDEKGVTMDS